MDNLDIIVNGCIRGNNNAREKLYHLYAAKLYGICLRYAGNDSEARDIMQEGFVKIFNHIKELKKVSSVEAWMKRIMINLAIEKYRTARRWVAAEDIRENPDTDENIISDITREELLGFIKQLSPQYQMVFNLYAIEGYSHKEISEKLNITEGTSKSNLSRARAILQEKIRTFYPRMDKEGI